MIKLNKVYLKDNLELMEDIEDKSIDLIYIDPPFFTQKTQKTSENSYEDKWDSLESYLDYMYNIIKEIYRILKDSGSFYLHCDYHALHYLKTICDEIFSINNFRNEIIWKRTSHRNQQDINKFAVVIDTIIFYTKTEQYIFQNIKTPLSKEQIERDYKYKEKQTGRRYSHHPLLKMGKSPKQIIFKDKGKFTAPEGYRFIWSQKTYDKRIKNNPHLIYWTKNGVPRYKTYLDKHKGVPLSNLWDKIESIQFGSKEWSGYPNQKPYELLERIIKISSKEGDIVADFFCGSGTTLVVAKQLRRKFIGCDINPKAVELTKKRLKNTHQFQNISDYL